MKKRKITNFKIASFLIIILSGVLGLAVAYMPNLDVNETNKLLFINKTNNFEDIKKVLYDSDAIKFQTSFELAAQLKRYPENVKPGRYLMDNTMGNFSLINKLRAGAQDPLNLTFNNVNTVEYLSSKLGKSLMADSSQFHDLLSDKEILNSLGFTEHTIMAMFIPNSYQVYWTVNPLSLINRMKTEYDKFWTSERLKKAEAIGLSPIEVSILASIVEKETYVDKENPIVAGVYMNRLKRRMKLSADPTVIFALQDYTIKRVLKKHLKVDSPYNTYKHYGLPPGPICSPSISAIDGVLNYKKHKFLYFCAKPDFSMEHSFARNFKEHLKNAKAFHKALDSKNIK